jgi:hypothetical protein|tara:strand:+ start:1911 stop:2207 length:297 start_codon:yes stop_codon:yes gene_type:complete
MERNETPNQGPEVLLDLRVNIAAIPIGTDSNEASMEAETDMETRYWRSDIERRSISTVITEMNTIRCLRSLSMPLESDRPMGLHAGDALMNHSALRST